MINRKTTVPEVHCKTTATMINRKPFSPTVNSTTTEAVDPSDPAGFWAANAEKMKRHEPTSTIGLVMKNPSSNLPGSAVFHHPSDPASKLDLPRLAAAVSNVGDKPPKRRQ